MLDKLLKRLQRQAEDAQARLNKFAEDLAQDPAHAFTWSNDAFKDAAKLRVLKQIINAIEQGGNVSMDNIRSTMTDRVLHRSKYPPQSTSPTSNLIEQYELAACAEILSDLDYI